MDNLLMVVFPIAAVAGTLVVIAKLHYELDDAALLVKLGRTSLRRIAIDDMADIRKGYAHVTESWAASIYPPRLLRDSVTIYRRSGLFRRFLITPLDPDGFVREVRAHQLYRPDSDSTGSRA